MNIVTNRNGDKYVTAYMFENSMGAIARSFAQVQERFVEVDNRFAKIDQRFNEIDIRFAKIDLRFNEIDQKFILIDQRFNEIDKKFIAIDQRFDEIDQKFIEIDKRFTRIEERLDKQDAILDLLLKEIRALRSESREDRLTMAALAHNDLKLEKRLEKLERKVG